MARQHRIGQKRPHPQWAVPRRIREWAGCLVLVAILAGVVPLAGCSSNGSSSPDLFLVSFLENQRTSLYRDQVLTFEFTTTVNRATVDLDTFQIFKGTTTNPTPFTGLFEVVGNYVYFHPVVDESDPLRGVTPVNPYGFDENTTYQVKIPSVNDTPTPLKVLESAGGKPNIQAFSGAFASGKEYTPRPNQPNPSFEAFAPAVYNVPNATFPGTPEEFDDVLSYTPVPNLVTPPTVPGSNPARSDFRVEHPTNVRAQLTFTEVMDPRSFRPQDGGNIRMEFNSPNSTAWNFIPTTITNSPNGRTFILTAATPLANEARYNKFRLVLDQTSSPLLSRAGKKLIEVVEKWDDGQKRVVRVDVTEPYLTMWCAQEQGESGPLLSASFPLQGYAMDKPQSDGDVVFAGGELGSGAVTPRTSEDTEACTQPYCTNALREPLTQSLSSPKPNPNTKGPSKVQFLINSPKHDQNSPTPGYKLANAEALVGMEWGPLCTTVIKSTYPKLHVHVMWSDKNSTAALPVGLVGTTYNSNFDKNPPGFPVRDGKTPYDIDQSSASATWYPWKFQQPFMDYRVDKGLVFLAWTEEGGEVEQYPRWYSPNNTPMTRVFSRPSQTANPSVGVDGQWTYYWSKFSFVRIRSLAVTQYFRMTQNSTDRPFYNSVVVSPSPANLPGGTDYQILYSGARFTSYTKEGTDDWRGNGSPTTKTGWTTNITNMNQLPAVALRVTFTANPGAPTETPFIDGVAFTFRL